MEENKGPRAEEAMQPNSDNGIETSKDTMANKAMETDELCPDVWEAQRARKIVSEYLMENVMEFRELCALRQKGWENEAGDKYFEKQRHIADNSNKTMDLRFYSMMQKVGEELHAATDAFRISRQAWGSPMILDMCAAPGGFLSTALRCNPQGRFLAYTLPNDMGGHKVRLQRSPNVVLRFMDITMLAADMGVTEIPEKHPDAANFLPRQFSKWQAFDLILCDGQVLRTHARASYREKREARRLIVTQLAIALEHVRQGGTMVVLLHKVESWETVSLLHTFSRFSWIKLFKPQIAHATRSSFYMVATNIQRQDPNAMSAVEMWKTVWKIATFGTDEEFLKMISKSESRVGAVLEEFGPRLIELGRDIWGIQARALARAPWLKTEKSNAAEERLIKTLGQ